MATKRRKKTARPRQSAVSRRRFLQSVIAASAATSAAAALPRVAEASEPATAGAAGAGAASAWQVLTEQQAGLLEDVLNRLIPAEGAMPGAGDIGVAAYIDGAMADAVHLRQPILDVLNEVAVAGKAGVRSPESLDRVLTQLERTHRDSFASLIDVAYTGYYSHPRVLQAIGWVPPGDEADTSERLDLAVLEDVIRRGPVYKHV